MCNENRERRWLGSWERFCLWEGFETMMSCWPIRGHFSQSEGISANQRDFRLGRGFRDKDVLLINHRFLDLLFAAHQQLKPGRRLRPTDLINFKIFCLRLGGLVPSLYVAGYLNSRNSNFQNYEIIELCCNNWVIS